MNALKKFEPTAYAALRIVFGFLFACHGASKVSTLFGGQKPHDVLGWTGAGIELVGGVLILIGLLTPRLLFWPAVKWRWRISWCTIREVFYP